MPFISKDWRSPGEAWVKTEEGWEKMKVLECSAPRRTDTTVEASADANTDMANPGCIWRGPAEGTRTPPPHCHITVKCTREIAGFNALSEAVRRLDFSSAVRDVRRFNYICALLHLLLATQRLARLPGDAQKLLLSMLEEVAAHVSMSQQNTGALRALLSALAALREAERVSCWGRPLGSRALWRHHDRTIARIQRLAHAPPANPAPQQGEGKRLQDIPEECVREVLLRLADHRDLEAAAGAWSAMASLCSETRVWRELARVHFTPQQIERVRATRDDWKDAYHALKRAHGLREDVQYAETLSLCRHCECLFWRSLGHPCIADTPEYSRRVRDAGGPLPPRPVPPHAFLEFFSL